MRRYQQGQSIVEFAFILPILVLFLIGLMYFGLMFSNYVALNNIARDAARSAAMVSAEEYKDVGYNKVRAALSGQSLPNSTYLWNPASAEQFKIEYIPSDTNNGEVVVTLTADLDRSNGSLAGTFFSVVGSGTLEKLVVTYHMYSEVNHETGDAGT